MLNTAGKEAILFMDAYTEFAQVYDEFMDNIPYAEWTEYILNLLIANNVIPQSDNNEIIELGCGTGTISRMLANIGYNVTGIDISQPMLDIAISKNNEQADICVEYDNQDMTSFKVDQKAAAIISVCDCVNYLLSEEDLFNTFMSVRNALKNDGIFIFDMKTEYFYKEILEDNIFADNKENASYIWENHYDEADLINTYKLTLYIKDNNSSDSCYKRYEEMHKQRAYKLDSIKNKLKKAGADKIKVYKAFTKKRPDSKSERVYFVVKFQNKYKTMNER